MKNVRVAILTDLVLVDTPARRPRLFASHLIAYDIGQTTPESQNVAQIRHNLSNEEIAQ